MSRPWKDHMRYTGPWTFSSRWQSELKVLAVFLHEWPHPLITGISPTGSYPHCHELKRLGWIVLGNCEDKPDWQVAGHLDFPWHKPLCIPVRQFLPWIDWGGKDHPKCGWHYSMGQQLKSNIPLSLLLDLRCNVINHLMLPPSCLPSVMDCNSPKLWAKTNPSFPMWL